MLRSVVIYNKKKKSVSGVHHFYGTRDGAEGSAVSYVTGMVDLSCGHLSMEDFEFVSFDGALSNEEGSAAVNDLGYQVLFLDC